MGPLNPIYPPLKGPYYGVLVRQHVGASHGDLQLGLGVEGVQGSGF